MFIKVKMESHGVARAPYTEQWVITTLESFIAQPERHGTTLGPGETSRFALNGFMGQFCHSLGWIISFRDLATSCMRGAEASLREGAT